MKKIRLLLTAATAVAALLPQSAAADVEPQPSIVDHITAGNSGNIIIQPRALEDRLDPSAAPAVNEQPAEARPTHGRMAGYRVQVFSDNNVHTAKNEARTKSRHISARFPQYRTYVLYTSPYWRLKVGDFRTRQEADEAAGEIRKAFPAYSKEIRVVRDRVNISQ